MSATSDRESDFESEDESNFQDKVFNVKSKTSSFFTQIRLITKIFWKTKRIKMSKMKVIQRQNQKMESIILKI